MLGILSTIIMIAGVIWAIILSFRGFGEAIAILGFIGIITLVILIGGISLFGFELFAVICAIFVGYIIYLGSKNNGG